ncbi:MAG: imidazole glycerol phosphate synthase subunit HisH [Microbacteriaceae bacterium]|nr:imidazole glycerol phosphate synthase subunit HisH [Microbacteriaceae bacterium]
MPSEISIVDYGVGNVASVQNMFRKAGIVAEVTGDPDRVAVSPKVLLPGVGAFDRAAGILRKTGLGEAIVQAAASGSQILGICLGMQLLMDKSEEGEGTESGLGLIPGSVVAFPPELKAQGLRVPHMGWNSITRVEDSAIFPALSNGDRFYFVHSYHAVPNDLSHRFASVKYGIEFSAMIHRDNVVGAQFHPEKSHRTGMALLRDFAESK